MKSRRKQFVSKLNECATFCRFETIYIGI